MKTLRLLPLLTLGMAFHYQAAADVKLPSVFSEHAVLQRGRPIPVWGTADAGEKVTVQFAGQTQTATANADGKWRVDLSPVKEMDSAVLTVKGKNTLTVNDIAVGEVWVASGQSNMEFTMTRDSNSAAAIAASADPGLRQFFVPHLGSDTPLTDIAGGKWTAAATTTTQSFSAVAYYFARELRKDLKVPVGIISTSVGGTPAEAWTSKAGLEAIPEINKQLEDSLQAQIKNFPALSEKYKVEEAKLLEKWQADTEKAKAEGKTPLPRKPAAPIDPTKSNNRPSCLYNAMIAPLQPYGIRGAIWYQGEANSGRARQYRTLFPAMIADWRKVWAEGEFPFFFVQIAPHNGMSPEIREAQLLTTQTVPHTAMAVTTDVGNAIDIHPTQKEPVGVRLALAARATVYGEKIEYSGPAFESMKVDGNKAILKFTHAEGLAAKDGALKGFTVTADGKTFVPAKAEIKGDTVIVSADGVATPTAARYGWDKVPDVNLVNGAGIPASPFRTDVEK